MPQFRFQRGIDAQLDNGPVTPQLVLQRNVGLGLTACKFRARVQRETRVTDGDYVLAEKLAAAGIEALSTRRITWVGDCTKRAINLPMLRQINIYESQMQLKRARFLKAANYLAQTSPGAKYFRYAVITSGQRIPAGGDLAGIKSQMMRRISDWARIIKTRFDIELLLNVVEFTFDKDERSFHLHFNVLYWPHRRLKASVWMEFLTFTRPFLGVVWKDCGAVQNFAELIKYVLKGVDRDDLTVTEAAWLYENLYRNRFIIAFNSLRASMLAIERNRQKLVYVAPAGGGPKVLRLVQLADKAEIDEHDEDSLTRDVQTENLVRGRTGAMHRASAWAEPGTLVENYTTEPKTEGGRIRLKNMLENSAASLAIWRENGAPPPAEALRMSDAALLAADDEAAEKIFAGAAAENDNIIDLKRRRAEGAYKVHTTDLTHGARRAKTGPPSAAPPAESQAEESGVKSQQKPAKYRIIVLPNENQETPAGKARPISYDIDPETGEVLAEFY